MLLEKVSPKGNTCTSYIIDENSRVISTKLLERWNLICACKNNERQNPEFLPLFPL